MTGGRPGVRAPARPRPGGAAAAPLAVAVVLGLVWAVVLPGVPDLSAQLARTHLVSTEGLVPFWASWYSGISTLGYSVLAPVLMGILSPQVVGVVAAAVTAVAGVELLAGTRRPRAGALLLAVLGVVDVCLGRLTFAAGAAVGLAALVAVRRNRPVAAAVVSVLCGLTSPLAGAFLALAYASAWVGRSGPLARRTWAVLAATTVLPLAVLQVLFPQPGFEPLSWWSALGALLVCGLVAALSPAASLKAGAALTAGLVAASWLAPNPLGGNAARLTEVVGLPLVVATAQAPGWWRARRRGLAVAGAAVTLVAAALPAALVVGELAGGLKAAGSPAAARTYWTPLAAELARLPASRQQRVEVVPPTGHWEVQYLDGVVLARGWERQTDEALNPLFYARASLTSTSYRRWLDRSGVAYVALPDASPDLGGVGEAALVAGGLPYLSLVWADPHWRLYAVSDPAPVVVGPAHVVAMSPTGLTIDVTGTEPVLVRLRWSRYLTYDGPPGCLAPDGVWTSLRLSRPSVVVLHAKWLASDGPGALGCGPAAR